MTTAKPKVDAIYPAMLAVAKDLKPIAKQRVQSFQAFLVDDVYANIGPLLKKHKIVVAPQVLSADYTEGVSKSGSPYVDARVLVQYVFHSAEDGSSLSYIFAAEGRDHGDKATNKAVQQAFKYALIQAFQISTGEVDPDAQHIEAGQPAPAVAANHWEVEAKKLAVRYAEAAGMEPPSLYKLALIKLELETVSTEGEMISVGEWLAHNAIKQATDAAEMPLEEETE